MWHALSEAGQGKDLLVINLSDESSVFAGCEVQLQPLPEFDVVEQCSKLLHGANITSLESGSTALHELVHEV